MWPRRKIQLAASSAVPGIGGVRAVLQGIQLDYSEGEPTQEDLSREIRDEWMERPFGSKNTHTAETFNPVTELVYWPDRDDDHSQREKVSAKGIIQQSVQSFIHNLLKDELIIWLAEPTVLIDDRPLLLHILDEAGFEPTLLWLTPAGQWRCERKQGLYWLISESWLDGLMEKNSVGREANWDNGKEKASWVIQENGIDFYRTQKRTKYVGYLPRWPNLAEEETAAHNIAMCIDLGVSWLDISLALGTIWKNIRTVDNLRWNTNDFGWNAGASGEELSAP